MPPFCEKTECMKKINGGSNIKKIQYLEKEPVCANKKFEIHLLAIKSKPS